MDLAPYGAPVYGVEAAVAGTLLASLTLGLPLTVRAVGRPAVPSGSWPGWAASPGWWLAVVVTAIYLNQLLFTVHVIRVHGGDPNFVARYLPDGWFALADDNRVIAALAAAFPWPQVLAPSVLRVPAVLELPFVVLAYLCACRWWSPRLYQRLATPAVLGAACAVYTVTFCLIEWRFRNPYTWHDLPLRALSGVATAVAVSWLARATRAAGRAGEDHRSAVDLALFGMSAAALGQLVLVVYDTALLYNLGHAGDQVASAVAALAVLAAARWAARHRQQPGTTGGAGPAPGGVVDTVGAGIAWFAALLFVPAVPLRYAIGFAPPASAAVAATVIVATAAALALRHGYHRLPYPRDTRAVATWFGRCGAAGLAGLAGAAAGLLAAGPAGYPESRLLAAAVAFLAGAVATAALMDRISAGRRRGRTGRPG